MKEDQKCGSHGRRNTEGSDEVPIVAVESSNRIGNPFRNQEISGVATEFQLQLWSK